MTTTALAPAFEGEQSAIDELNRLNAGFEQDIRNAVEKGIRMGEILVNVKARLPHGEFQPWIALNCKFVAKTATIYMAAYRNKARFGAGLNGTETLKQLAGLKLSPDGVPMIPVVSRPVRSPATETVWEPIAGVKAALAAQKATSHVEVAKAHKCPSCGETFTD